MFRLKRFSALRFSRRFYNTEGQEHIDRPIDNIGIIAHIDAGKTTTTERMLFYSGTSSFLGNVDDGDTVTDYMVQERERGITITSAAITFPWSGYRINLIDTPGHVERSVRVLDGAVAIFDAVTGVEAQSKTVWRQADRYGVPRIAYINKMDKVGANVHNAIQTMVDKLDAKPLLTQLPLGEENHFRGVLDLITMQEHIWPGDDKGKTMLSRDILSNHPLFDEITTARQNLIESMANIDEIFADLYLSGSEMKSTDLISALKRITVERKGVAILLGSSFKNKGVQLLMDAMCSYLPSPDERPPSLAVNSRGEKISLPLNLNGIFAALAFKVIFDPHKGALVFVRIYSGTLKCNSKIPVTIYNTNKKKSEKVTRIMQMHANVPEDIASVSAGNIAVLVGCQETSTGDTLMIESKKSDPLILEGVSIPKPVFFCSVEPESTSQQEILEKALIQLQKEDPTFQVSTSPETGQMLIAGMGELHLDIIADRLKREFKVLCSTGSVQISYRETILESSETTQVAEKIINGKNIQVRLHLAIEPRERGEGNQVLMDLSTKECEPNVDNVKLYTEAIKRGAISALSRGAGLGFPMEDTLVRVIGVSVNPNHRQDQNEIALVSCAAMSITKEVESMHQAGKTRFLEPIMSVEVRTDNNYIGVILNDLSSGKRGNIKGIGHENGENVVSAEVPLSSLIGYSSYMRSLTSGNAHFNMEFCNYAEVTQSEQAKIIKKVKGY